jgi:hypothetical protein
MTTTKRISKYTLQEVYKCHECNKNKGFTVTTEKSAWQLSIGPDDEKAELTTLVPVHTCNNCGEAFTDWVADEINTAAQYKYYKENRKDLTDELLIKWYGKHYKDWLANYNRGDTNASDS